MKHVYLVFSMPKEMPAVDIQVCSSKKAAIKLVKELREFKHIAYYEKYEVLNINAW